MRQTKKIALWTISGSRDASHITFSLVSGRPSGIPYNCMLQLTPPHLPQQRHTSLEKKLESESVRGWKESPESLIWQPGGQSSGQPLAQCLASSINSSPDSPLLWFALLIFKGNGRWVHFSFFFCVCLFLLQSFVFILVTIWWKCSCCGKRWFWPHVSPRHDECSEAVLVREGIARAAGTGPAQASLGWGWRRTLFSFFDLHQDLEIRK